MVLERVLALIAVVFALAAGAARAEVIDAQASYPEGAIWRDGKIFYTEMGADQVSYFEGADKRIHWRERGCGPTSIAPYGAGIVVLCHPTAELVALDGAGRTVRRWSRLDAGGLLQDPNDSSADGRGGVYISDPGAFSMDARVSGEVLYLSSRGALRRVAQGLRYPNGVFVDRRENALYVNEHLNRRVLRFQIQADGALGPMSVFADLNKLTRRVGTYREAGPDGIERGPDGDFYVCLYGEGRILRLDASGALVRSIAVPTPFVTSIAFSPDGTAYVTGTFENMAPPYPGAVVKLAPDALRASGRGG